MQLLIFTILTLFSSTTFGASEDQEIRELFKNYNLIMDGQKTEIVDQVFSQKYLTGSGGKESFIKKVKSSKNDQKLLPPPAVTWKKGELDEIYFAKLNPKSESKFVIKKENGKLKIDGTIGDEE